VPKYFAPAFRIEINGSRLQGDVSMNIQQVEVTSMPDTLDEFSFTLVNSLPRMRWTHTDDADLFRPGSSVRILMGYVDDLHLMMEGEITDVSPTFPADGVPTVGIKGHSRMHRLRGDNKTRTFQNTNAKQIVEKIGKDAGLDVKADDVEVMQDYVIQPNQSDLEFLKGIAKGLHFEVLVQNKTLIFRKAKESTPKVFTFIWFGTQESFAPTPDTLPLKSFSPEMKTLAPTNTAVHRAYDMKSKKPFISSASSADQTTLMGGQQSGAAQSASAFNMERTTTVVTQPFASKDEGDRMAKATYEAKAMDYIGGHAETIGVPELWSGQVVEFKGLGPVFSGLYYISQATHTIAESGYQTSFEVKRNAS
jgi:phage protein D